MFIENKTCKVVAVNIPRALAHTVDVVHMFIIVNRLLCYTCHLHCRHLLLSHFSVSVIQVAANAGRIARAGRTKAVFCIRLCYLFTLR